MQQRERPQGHGVGHGTGSDLRADLQAPADGFADGRGSEARRGCAPAEDLVELAVGARSASMFGGVRPCPVGRCDLALRPFDPCAQTPCAALTELILVRRQYRRRRVADCACICDVDTVAGVEAQQLLLDSAPRLEPWVVTTAA